MNVFERMIKPKTMNFWAEEFGNCTVYHFGIVDLEFLKARIKTLDEKPLVTNTDFVKVLAQGKEIEIIEEKAETELDMPKEEAYLVDSTLRAMGLPKTNKPKK